MNVQGKTFMISGGGSGLGAFNVMRLAAAVIAGNEPLAVHIVENQMLNGEVIRLDGVIRMAAQ